MKNKKILILIMIPFLLIFSLYCFFNIKVKIPELPPIKSLSFKKTSMEGPYFVVNCQEVDEKNLKKAMSNLALKHPDGWFRVNPFINSIPVHYIYLNNSGSSSSIQLYRDAISFIFYQNGQRIPLAKVIGKEEVQEFIDLLCAKRDDVK